MASWNAVGAIGTVVSVLLGVVAFFPFSPQNDGVIAVITPITPAPYYVNDIIEFSAKSSTPSKDSTIVSYEWDFEGTKKTGIIVQHAFQTNSKHLVSLTIKDSSEKSTKNEIFIDVFNKTTSLSDNDHDRVTNSEDNCPNTSNPDQNDSDQNGIGDLCEKDSMMEENISPEIDRLLKEGQFYYDSKQYGDAIKSFDNVISIDPNLAKSWHWRGLALVYLAMDVGYVNNDEEVGTKHEDALRYFKEATDSLNKAIELNPDDLNAWNSHGFALVKLGSYQDYLKNGYMNDYQNTPENAQESFKEALSDFEHVTKTDPKNHEAWYYRGEVLEIMERWEDSRTSYQQALTLAPEIYKNKYPFN